MTEDAITVISSKTVRKSLGKRNKVLLRISPDLDRWLNQQVAAPYSKNWIIQDILERFRSENKAWPPKEKGKKS